MGPRHYSRGNRRGMVNPFRVSRNRFQWGHDITVVETSRVTQNNYNPVFSFNGATTLQSWKPPIMGYSITIRYCFNGATTLQSWKLRFAVSNSREVDKVSMGPRHYSRGNFNYSARKI